jgi:hypothetical protein
MSALRPLPNVDDAAAMAKLGRLSALRSARLDVMHALRDVASRLMSGQSDELKEIAEARLLLDRLEEINGIEAHA